MKRLIFLTTFDYPSRYAHPIHGLHMARAFHKALGNNFLFMVNTDVGQVLSAIPHRRLFGRFGRRVKKLHIRSVLLPFSLVWFFMRYKEWRGGETVVFVNDPRLLRVVTFLQWIFGTRFIFESHGLLDARAVRRLSRDAARVIFTTPFLAEEAYAQAPQIREKSLVCGNAVDLTLFDSVTQTRDELRKTLKLPDGFLIGYVGRFEPRGEDKGLRFIIRAIKEFPDSVRGVLVGGAKDEIPEYEAYARHEGVEGRITFISHVTPDLVPQFEKACDVLAYVPSTPTIFYEKETSPMKLYEYMASERPMIVSDLPTTRAVVTDAEAFFIEPGSTLAFTSAINSLRTNPEEGVRRALSARAAVERNTWDARAARILEGLQ